MKKSPHVFRDSIVWMACISLLAAQLATAATPVANGPMKKAPVIRDLALQDGGLLHGTVLDAQGRPLAGLQVMLATQGKTLAALQTDQEGRFVAASLSAGVYQMQAGETVALYRAWAPRTAPPSAVNSALLVANETVVRGKKVGNPVIGAMTHPIFLGCIVATAIGVPLALDDNSGS